MLEGNHSQHSPKLHLGSCPGQDPTPQPCLPSTRHSPIYTSARPTSAYTTPVCTQLCSTGPSGLKVSYRESPAPYILPHLKTGDVLDADTTVTLSHWIYRCLVSHTLAAIIASYTSGAHLLFPQHTWCLSASLILNPLA